MDKIYINSILYKKNKNIALTGIYVIFFYIFCFFSILASPILASMNNLNLLSSVRSHEYSQWFTGPILTPTPITMPVGHPGLEVAWLIGESYGYYNSHWNVKHLPKMWSTGPYVDFQIGFNKFLGAEYIGALLTNFSQGAHYTHLIDSIFRFGFQISNDQKDSWVPDFRILFQETVPTGKYQRLSLSKHGTDISGEGSFQTGVHFAFQKLFHSKKEHDFRLRWTFGYFIPASVKISGLNYLGGCSETKGTIRKGQFFTGYICGEYALSRRWAICVESNYQFGARGRFSKKRGGEIYLPAFSHFSVAPELQHTFSPNLGVLMGTWFSVAGKNSSAFVKYFVSVLYSF
ncbi:MAG: hypothetical protein WCP39_00625 [Chlamydiota bacterium]